MIMTLDTEKIISLMQTDYSIDAPADRIAAVKRAFRSFGPQPATLLQRIKAALTVDLPAGQAAFGERSATGSTSRQMLFDAGDVAIDIRVSDLGDAFYVYGQILADADISGTIELIGDNDRRDAAIGDNGRFDLGNVAAGVYSIEITGMVNIEAGPFKVG